MLKIMHRINTIEQLKNVPKEYGVEIDIRDYKDRLILNHEPYKDGESFEEYCRKFRHAIMVLNPKVSGIQDDVLKIVKKHGINSRMWLDLPFPDMFGLIKKGEKKVAVRFSEYEPVEQALALAGKAEWVWADTFTKLPLSREIHDRLKQSGFRLCLVGPDRWNRPDDIRKYVMIMKSQGIKLDAVMTEQKYAGLWD